MKKIFKKILYVITLSFLPNDTKVAIKCVSWLVFQFLTVGIWVEKISLEGWLWNVYYRTSDQIRKRNLIKHTLYFRKLIGKKIQGFGMITSIDSVLNYDDKKGSFDGIKYRTETNNLLTLEIIAAKSIIKTGAFFDFKHGFEYKIID